MNRRSLIAAACGAALVLAACGSEEEMADSTAAAAVDAPSSNAAATEAGVTIERAWARTSPMNVETGAAYMMITSVEDDKLLGAAVDPSIAAKAEVHEVVMADGDMSGDMSMSSEMPMSSEMTGATMAPMMQMREVEYVDLPAGEAVMLQPGGYHIMLLELASPLELGEEFVVTLTFEEAGDVDVTVVVADDAP